MQPSEGQSWEPFRLDIRARASGSRLRAAALSFLLQLVNAIVSGRLPHLPALLDRRLNPIWKSPSNSIRPTAIEEVWA
jgi:hypothetical protein